MRVLFILFIAPILGVSCRECLVGSDTCPELMEQYVTVRSARGTGYRGSVTGYAEFGEECSSLNVQTRTLDNDSGYSSISQASFYIGTKKTSVHLERTTGDSPILVWYRIGDVTDTIAEGVITYDGVRE